MKLCWRGLSSCHNEGQQEGPMARSQAPTEFPRGIGCITPQVSRTNLGFSMPEVLVSSALLAMLVATSTQIYMNSGTTMQRTGLRDAVNARIAQDLEGLRRETWRWACEDGSEGGSSTACTGATGDADKPVAYKTGRSVYSTFPELARYKSACGFDSNGNRIPQTTAALMQQEQRLSDGSLAFPAGPTPLSWTSSLPASSNPAPHTTRITIQRQITVNAIDRNQLDVTYTTSASSPVQTSLQASLTPQALNWCP